MQLAASWPDHLDDQRTIFIRPDVVHVVRGKPVGVLDAKYKLEDASSSYPNADVYQMLAYCTTLALTAAGRSTHRGTPRVFRKGEGCRDRSGGVHQGEQRLRSEERRVGKEC